MGLNRRVTQGYTILRFTTSSAGQVLVSPCFSVDIHPSFPYLIIGSFCASSVITAYNLPETKGRPIPNSYADAKAQEE